MPEAHIKRFRIDISKTIDVPCRPMKDILEEANVKKVDFFSLDVEGAEMDILETIDWSIPISVFLIEVTSHREQIRQKMFSEGFRLANFDLRKFCVKGWSCLLNDLFFHKDFNVPS